MTIKGKNKKLLLSRFRLRKQLLLSLLPILLTLAIIAAYSQINFFQFSQRNVAYSRAVDNEIAYLNLDRDFTELQRAVLVYSSVGYDGILTKITHILKRLDGQFISLKASIFREEPEIQDRFTRMADHYDRYKIGFIDVQRKQAEIGRLHKDVILKSLGDLISGYQEQYEVLTQSNQRAKKAQVAEVLLDLNQIVANVNLLLADADSSVIEKTEVLVTTTEEVMREFDGDEINAQRLSELYHNDFKRLITLNRSYLYLLNIVLAGRSVEIDRLSQEIKSLTTAETQQIYKAIQASTRRTQILYTVLTIIGGLIGIATTWYMAARIATPIQDMASTFRRLTQQEKNVSIPGLERRDEIGDMARVASDYKDMTRRLEQQTEKLMSSNEELERFAYICSHDLKEPLRMINNFSEILTEEIEESIADNEDAVKALEFINQGASNAQEMISDILIYSRLTDKEQRNEIVDLNRLVAQVCTAVKGSSNRDDITFSVDTLPTLRANVTQMQQLFQNLIGNGVKFCSSETRPIISVRVKSAQDYWQFSVQDNGIGMDPRYVDKIFIIFQRLNNREKFHGTGIGLAIVKKIVEAYGGKIWVDTAIDKGSTFHFTIDKRFIVGD